MIPSEVADLCQVLDKDWPNLPEEDFKTVLEIAYDIYNAGYRKTAQSIGIGK